jgi:phenylpropionate dioxygenase-like ring-hydroxylating dioxygenase large terminal subunit
VSVTQGSEIPRAPARPGGGRYLRNSWYVAGWSDDLDATPLARTFLDEPVALYRDEDGVAHAIGGMCPHRFAALGNGRVVGAELECPYHGLRFDASGRCVFNPHEKGVVPRVSVPAYPLVERHRLIWIWMGDAALADPSVIPDFAWLADPRLEAVRGTARAEGHYELYSDNILDLAHSNYVHPALAANAWSIGKRRFRQEGDTVWSEYTHPNDYLADGINMILGRQGQRQDFFCDVRWNAPAVLFLDYRAGPPGTPKEQTTALPSLHAFTPESGDTTHYFWAVARDFALGDDGFSQAMRGALENAFEHEDMPIIRDAHRLMAGRDFWDLNPVVLTGDGGGVRARRVLERLIRDEEQGNRAAAE